MARENRNWKRIWMLAFCVAAFPMVSWAHRDGADPFKTGGPFPGESVCTECHSNGSINRPNQGPGSVTFSVSPYKPGEKQVITVTVSDPNQSRWGFEITARLASSTLTAAGSFRAVDDNAQLICDTGLGPPCAAGKPQFVTHTLGGTRRGTRNSASFQVEWTAPSSNVGDIIFAAAGNAANNSDTEQGDNIYIKQVTISFAADSPAPTISAGGVVGAGLSSPAVKQISPGGIISIFGQNFAPAGTVKLVGGSDLVDGKLPTNFADLCVQVGSDKARFFHVFSGQLNVQAPTIADRGNVSVQVIQNCGQANELRSNTETVTMQAESPEFFFFKQNADGKNPIAAINAVTFGLIGAPGLLPGVTFTPAKPGDILALYSTGLGAVNPAVQAGVLPPGIASTLDPVTVTVGALNADVLYAGVAPGLAGLYQINIKVPDAAPDGDLPVVARLGSFSTPAGAFITVKK